MLGFFHAFSKSGVFSHHKSCDTINYLIDNSIPITIPCSDFLKADQVITARASLCPMSVTKSDSNFGKFIEQLLDPLSQSTDKELKHCFLTPSCRR